MNAIRSVFSFALLLPLLAPTTARAAWPHHPKLNVPLVTNPYGDLLTGMIADGAGGAIIVWQLETLSLSGRDIRAHHLLASGTLDPSWPAGGVDVCSAPGDQFAPRCVSDGAGGATITWQDQRGADDDIYVHHVLSSGIVDPNWPVGGRALCTSVGSQFYPSILTDGQGGAYVAWSDVRTGTARVVVHRILASGVPDPGWPQFGRAVSTGASWQSDPRLASDGSGGLLVGWRQSSGFRDSACVQRVDSYGSTHTGWPAAGLLVTGPSLRAYLSRIVANPGGDAIVFTGEVANGPYEVKAYHVLTSGSLDPIWPSGGVVLGPKEDAEDPSYFPFDAVSDGAGGAYATWSLTKLTQGPYDFDAYVGHVLAGGTVDPAWPASGLLLPSAAGSQFSGSLVPDGTGGVLAISRRAERLYFPNDVYAHHIRAGGSFDPNWPALGRPVCTASSDQNHALAVTDGAGGFIAAWWDYRSSPDPDIYAQRVQADGLLTDMEPVIAAVHDVPADQGGRLQLFWTPSPGDGAAYPTTARYSIWRQVSESLVLAAERAGAIRVRDGEPIADHSRGVIRVSGPSASPLFWEFIQEVAANRLPGYSALVATTADSLPWTVPVNVFAVSALDTMGGEPRHFFSASVSGYSVDNLAPSTPTPFTGAAAATSLALHWGVSRERDFAAYRVYRGASEGFVPGPGTLVAQKPDTGYVDANGHGAYFKLTAVDVHGNESGYALLRPSDVTGVSGTNLPSEFSFALSSPNPMRRGATFRLSLPRPGPITLALYDPGGRRVRTLASGFRPAGESTMEWDGLQSNGQLVPNGLYFARLETGDRSLRLRIAVVH